MSQEWKRFHVRNALYVQYALNGRKQHLLWIEPIRFMQKSRITFASTSVVFEMLLKIFKVHFVGGVMQWSKSGS